MSEAVKEGVQGTEAPAKNDAAAVLGGIADRLGTMEKAIGELGKVVDSPAGKFSKAPHVTSGPVGKDSAGYSVLKMAGLAMGVYDENDCKNEIDLSNRLKAAYKNHGFNLHSPRGSYLVPFGSEHLPTYIDEFKVLAKECREKSVAGVANADPDEMAWAVKKAFANDPIGREKALGTLSGILGGSLVDFPSMGELIDLQRNAEVFSRLGAREITLPPQGRISFPKRTGATTAYMVGEAQSTTQSDPATGSLLLEAKKMAVVTVLNDEFIRFSSQSAEAFVRADMAAVAARKWDQQMLTGIGGQNNVRGLLNLATTGSDPLTTHTAVDVPANGNTGYLFRPEDAELMDSELPDAIESGTAWLMRKGLWGRIVTRRADAITAADAQGQFVFNQFRGLADSIAKTLIGSPVVRSNTVPNDRVRGSATNLTCAIYGYWPDWLIGRVGVVEFVSNNLSDTFFANVQTGLRMVQYADAGARHPASFNLFDQIRIA